MGVKMLLFAKCKFPDGVLEKWALKASKSFMGQIFSIDFNYAWIEVTPVSYTHLTLPTTPYV